MSNIVMSDDKKTEDNKNDAEKKASILDKPLPEKNTNINDATLVLNRDKDKAKDDKAEVKEEKKEDPDATVIARRSDMPELDKALKKAVSPTSETSPSPAAPPASKTPEAEKPATPSTGKLTQPGDEKVGTKSKINLADAHVLVVEDNVPNFVLIARLLAFMGIQRCEWKTSGWQVVEFADTLPRIDLVLMDIRLPYEDGFQALKRIRDHDKLKETLVIAVTAEASAEQMRKAQESGFDGFLAKPLNPDKFPDQIKRVLNGEPVWEWQSG